LAAAPSINVTPTICLLSKVGILPVPSGKVAASGRAIATKSNDDHKNRAGM
jgi:hypothetical protein